MRQLIAPLVLLAAISSADVDGQAVNSGSDAQDRCPVSRLPTLPEVGFAPDQGAEALILKAIDASTSSVRLSAFAFSSRLIRNALIMAKRRGIDVRVVVDERHNIDDDPKRIGRNALGALANAGIPVRTNHDYRIHHDKFIVVDACHVQTGSYNYTDSANKNSENVVVLWNNPDLAAKYLAHWESRFAQAVPFDETK